MERRDTIFALSSAPGRAGVSVFRLSGPQSGPIVNAITQRANPAPRMAALRKLFSRDGALIDEALVLWMPAPKSFTGEDSAEFQAHGSPAVLEALAAALLSAGARHAEAGEFTRRAFENGKIDLTEAEGLADLIDAETDGQRQQALRQMQGGLKARYEDWRESLLDALAQIEGEIDFPDEEDIPDNLAHKAYAPLGSLAAKMEELLAHGTRGERVRAGLDIAIIGPPNAGKSSLINALVNRDAAIVTDIAGTTRDIIGVDLVLAGLPIRLSDTAGLRESDDPIETEGIRRARMAAKQADLRIFIQDGRSDGAAPDISALAQSGDFWLLNKSDLGSSALSPPDDLLGFNLSAKTGEGLEAFKTALEAAVQARFSPSRDAGLTRARHRDCVARALASTKRAQSALSRAPELAGDDLRSALHALEELAGKTDVEAVFDRIFSRFCVGK